MQLTSRRKTPRRAFMQLRLVDLRGIEPLTSSMPRKRAPAAPQARSSLIVPEGHVTRRVAVFPQSKCEWRGDSSLN